MMSELISGRECMTIVVPVYNRAGLIVRCLDSIFAQTYRPLNVVVVDNASSDSTPDVVRKWADSHISDDFSVSLLHEGRRGAAYARQTGLDNTVSDKVMFFDSDDYMRPECVSAAMEAWHEAPSADIVAWPAAIHYKSGVSVTHPITGNLMERHLVHAVLRTVGYAVKTDFMKKAGGWRGEFQVWDDFETGARLLLGNPKVKAISRPLVDVYPQEESITGTSYSQKTGKWELSLDAIEKSIKESGRPDMERLLNIVDYRRVILAASYAKEGREDLALPLYRDTVDSVSPRCRRICRFSYHWTKSGLRGAFSIAGRWL